MQGWPFGVPINDVLLGQRLNQHSEIRGHRATSEEHLRRGRGWDWIDPHSW
jgi:hypothetical protein